jgi:predicted DNA-binding protein
MKNIKNAEAVGISFRLPKETADKMYAVLDKSGKPSTTFITYAVEWYIAHLYGQQLADQDPYQIDKFTVKLLNKKG